MSVRLRDMTVADLPRVMELEEELFAPDTWTEWMYRDELARPDTRHYLVAVDADADADAVVGYAGLISYPYEAHIATIGVTGTRQQEGIGALLLDTLLAEADGRRTPVLLEVREDDEATQAFYRRRGFAEIGRRPNYYPLSGKDAVVMLREVAR
ncbi:ribosomal protein S18-alanine N-acetyltransferase [Modestobacter marinus]|uniref:[Ribosomal protein bS18]-alanine N-acetyltransferase n=1 Tax=Modestobacter marinus TaxID=477641 RepID=A0A846LZ38_9ACTN|nr:ribosomal protein S18-alanine N-acetyltransferase [Modestobacter marinus]NIH67580.1 ribosomal-protein-alanine N-acetyltransferase [Modestobacter marinus]GGL73022.1 ribosomal-protein-alanine acetyltransferase [Modestobacter marinus]